MKGSYQTVVRRPSSLKMFVSDTHQSQVLGIVVAKEGGILLKFSYHLSFLAQGSTRVVPKVMSNNFFVK